MQPASIPPPGAGTPQSDVVESPLPAQAPAQAGDGAAVQLAPPRWPPWTILAALVSGLVWTVVAVALLVAGLEIAGVHIDTNNLPIGVTVGSTVLQDLAFIGSALIFARMAAPPRPWQFGLRLTSLRRALKWAAIVTGCYLLAAGIYASAISTSAKNQLPGLGASSPAASIAAVAVLVCVVAPISEEFFFRGFVFGSLRSYIGVWGAAIVTGVLFGAVHLAGPTPAVLGPLLAMLGFALCMLYWRTGSLLPGIALHSLNNAVAFGSLVSWSWQVVPLALGGWAVIALLLGPIASRQPRPLVAAT
jgi:CAAX protease family protein